MIATATTKITIKRLDNIDVSDTDPWERSSEATPLDPPFIIATGVRAALDIEPFIRSAGSEAPGDTETVSILMSCDPTDMNFRDLVLDETTGVEYEVIWVFQQPGHAGLGLTQAKLRTVTGLANE
jgi:hypothetical protein